MIVKQAYAKETGQGEKVFHRKVPFYVTAKVKVRLNGRAQSRQGKEKGMYCAYVSIRRAFESARRLPYPAVPAV
jgi:hypothetical protein